VVFLHGFPEIWYSWRHQMRAVAAAGYRAIAPDCRGYGLSEQPPEHEEVSPDDLIADVLGILDALSVPKVKQGLRRQPTERTKRRSVQSMSPRSELLLPRACRRSWWARTSAPCRRTSSRCSTRAAPSAWCAWASPSTRPPCPSTPSCPKDSTSCAGACVAARH
jgi:hypothetical protein